MPNAPKTPTRTIRVSDELWDSALRKANEEGITLTSVVIRALQDFVGRWDAQPNYGFDSRTSVSYSKPLDEPVSDLPQFDEDDLDY